MSTFGEDLIQSLEEALAHAKGRRFGNRSRGLVPTRSSRADQAHPSADGSAHGNEPVRLPEMGAGKAASQRPGNDSSSSHRERTGSRQACVAIFLTFQLRKSRILRGMIPRPVAGVSAPREDAVHGALDPAATLGLVPSDVERGVFEQGVAVVEERYLRVVQMVVNPPSHGLPRHVRPLPQIIDEPRNDDAHRRALVALRVKPIPCVARTVPVAPVYVDEVASALVQCG